MEYGAIKRRSRNSRGDVTRRISTRARRAISFSVNLGRDARTHSRTHSTRSRRRRILRPTFLFQDRVGVEPGESFSSPKTGTKYSALERNAERNTGGCSRYKTSPRCGDRSASVGTMQGRQRALAGRMHAYGGSAVAGFVPTVGRCTAALQWCWSFACLRAWLELTDCLYVCACVLACSLYQAVVCTTTG